jgi:hypothetical protein
MTTDFISGAILQQVLMRGKCDSGMGASATVIVSSDFEGFGDDYFNSKYYMQIVKNANSVGNAPENQIRNITDFVDSTGTFTVDAFGANVEENDEFLIIHELLYKALNKDGNNTFDQSTDSLEAIAEAIAGLGGGSEILLAGACDSGMGASTITIVSDDLTGYGDDYFNNKFWLHIVKNANSVGNAPEGEYRIITDYVSSTGTFTTNAFSVNVEENDSIYIIHESIYLQLSDKGSYKTTEKSLVRQYTAKDAITAGELAELLGSGEVMQTQVDDGAIVDFEAGATTLIDTCYESLQERVVIVYRDGGDGGKGKAIVGTVDSSDNSISYGTAVTFDTDNIERTCTVSYDEAEDRILILYNSSTDSKAYGIVGNVTGGGTNSITFGTRVQLLVGDEFSASQGFSAYDSDEQRIVLVYELGSTGVPYVIVCEVDSGTESVSFGTPVAIDIGGLAEHFGICYHPVEKVMCVQHLTSTLDGSVIICKVDSSDNSITIGTTQPYDTGAIDDYEQGIVYDSKHNRIVVAYQDDTVSDYVNVSVGTVDGIKKTISWGTKTVIRSTVGTWVTIGYNESTGYVYVAYNDVTGGSGDYDVIEVDPSDNSVTSLYAGEFEPATPDYISIVYDRTTNRIVIAYMDDNDSDKGKGIVVNYHSLLSVIPQESVADTATVYCRHFFAGDIDNSRTGIIPGAYYYSGNGVGISTTEILLLTSVYL